MGKKKTKFNSRLRTAVQVCFAAVSNGYIRGFKEGRIYTGDLKKLCVPGLNCYSCPGALGSCPIGALQSTLADRRYSFAFYVIGFLMIVGSFFGRLVCGWLCPFGLIQDLLYKIPFFKKLTRLPGEKYIKKLKYVILLVFVVLLPLFAVDIIGQGSPWFCKYICPAGTLEGGIPLVAMNEALRSAIGWLYKWKVAILAATVIASLLIYRPFCRYICPLGAIYGMFNPVSIYRYKIDEHKCTKCSACSKKCKLDIDVIKNPNSPDCIRCGECKAVCPENAITTTIDILTKKEENNGKQA